MKLWDQSLRICPKCRAKLKFENEEKRPCPQCGATVWFFNYRPLPSPPPVPELPSNDLWSHPTTTLLLGAVGLFGLGTVVAFFSSAIVGVASTLGAIGFAIFGMLRHAEARAAEQKIEHLANVAKHAAASHAQVAELTRRYMHLLATGDQRIEHYYREIYKAAEREKIAAEEALAAAQLERARAATVEQRIYQMADRLVQDNMKWVANKLRADPENYQRQKRTLSKTFDFVESVGYELPGDIRQRALADLKASYQDKVREQKAKDEQRRIKQQLREEARIQEQRDQELREAEAREAELAERLEQALSAQAGEYSQEIEALRAQLAEAHEKSERAKSMAQLTKVGHVYILSNIGSFGEDVFKVGMTRREDPSYRVRELGDASVPFPFDVHAMIACDDAPALENALHRELTEFRVNRVNLRKEYFRVEIDTILTAVRKHHGKVEYVAEPEALEYRESLTISPEELVATTREYDEMGVSYNEDDELDTATVTR